MSFAATEALQGQLPALDASAPPVREDTLLPLARLAVSGNVDAVRELVRRTGPHVLRTVRQVMGARHPDVEDITQDAILSLLSALTEFRAESTVLHFAHRIALLTALAARRRLGTRERRQALTQVEEQLDTNPESSPHAELVSQLRRQVIRNLLDELQEPIAEAMAMHFVLGFTVEEIATTADVPQNTVWSRLRLGKATLRKRLSRNPKLLELVRVFE